MCLVVARLAQGRSPHGERGLKSKLPEFLSFGTRRSPHGERGLKLTAQGDRYGLNRSLPSRGAWIEMLTAILLPWLAVSRSPHGERGLKYQLSPQPTERPCRSPHGERGLK